MRAGLLLALAVVPLAALAAPKKQKGKQASSSKEPAASGGTTAAKPHPRIDTKPYNANSKECKALKKAKDSGKSPHASCVLGETNWQNCHLNDGKSTDRHSEHLLIKDLLFRATGNTKPVPPLIEIVNLMEPCNTCMKNIGELLDQKGNENVHVVIHYCGPSTAKGLSHDVSRAAADRAADRGRSPTRSHSQGSRSNSAGSQSSRSKSAGSQGSRSNSAGSQGSRSKSVGSSAGQTKQQQSTSRTRSSSSNKGKDGKDKGKNKKAPEGKCDAGAGGDKECKSLDDISKCEDITVEMFKGNLKEASKYCNTWAPQGSKPACRWNGKVTPPTPPCQPKPAKS